MRATGVTFVMLASFGAVSGCADTPVSTEPSESVEAAPAAIESQALPKRPLRLGRPPHLSKTAREYQPLADYLGEAIVHRIVVRVPRSYDEVVRKLVEGDLDLALLTPFAYVTAKQREPRLQLLASLLGEGSPKYRGYIVVKNGSPLSTLEQLRSKRFAFVDRRSTSGYLFPRARLLQAGLDSERDFKSVQFAGNHMAVVRAVLKGDVDAGAIASTTYSHMRGEDLPSKLTIVGKTDWIPLDAFVAHPTIPASVVDELRRTLLGLSVRTARGREVLTGVTHTNGFVSADDSRYDGVRRVAARLEAASVKGSGGGQGIPQTGSNAR